MDLVPYIYIIRKSLDICVNMLLFNYNFSCVILLSS